MSRNSSRIAFAVLIVALAGCASSRDPYAAKPTRVQIIGWPEVTNVSLDCGGRRTSATTPFEFDFPGGPSARCAADFSAPHFQTLHVDLDRRYLFDHGELTSRADVAGGPRLAPPYGRGNLWSAVIVSIELAIDHLVNAAHRAALESQPDITLRVSLQPEPAS